MRGEGGGEVKAIRRVRRKRGWGDDRYEGVMAREKMRG